MAMNDQLIPEPSAALRCVGHFRVAAVHVVIDCNKVKIPAGYVDRLLKIRNPFLEPAAYALSASQNGGTLILIDAAHSL
jgi:hypothetical protein